MASVLRGSGASTLGGALDVQGVLSYEDVTSVDSIGIVTARSGLHVGTGASIFSPDTNELALGTNNTQRLTVASGGNIGVKNTAPNNTLTIGDGVQTSYAPSTAGNYLEIARTGGADAGLLINKNTGQWLVGIDNSDGANSPLRFEYGAAGSAHPGFGAGTLGMIITSDGDVGIDQTNPQGDLHIGNITGNKDLIMHSVNNGTARLRFREGGSTASGFNEYSIGMVGNRNAMTVNGQGSGEIIAIMGDTGKVGILNTNPTHLLHISKNTSGEVAGFKISGNDGSGDGGSGVNLADNETVKWSIFTRRYSNNNRLYISTAENDASSSRVTITEGGNVGINESSPNRKLVISQANSTAYSGTDFDQDYHVLKLNNTTDSKSVGMQFLIGSNGEAAITATEVSDGATDLIFGMRSSGSRAERFRMHNSGNFISYGGAKIQHYGGNSQNSSSFTIDITTSGSSYAGGFLIAQGYHYGNANYGASRVSIVSVGPTGLIDQNILNHATGLGGSWSFSRLDNSTIRVTKVAGSYNGGISWNVCFIGNN